MRKLFIFMLSSFVIGNLVAWSMGAWPIDFKRQPYDNQEQLTLADLKEELAENPDEIALLVELGSMYSLHNDIDQAAVLLDKAMSLAPEDPQVLAWHSANAAKLSGARLDVTWGLYKLYTLKHALSELSRAVTLAPNDLSVRLVRLASFAHTGTINPLFTQVFDDEQWFKKLLIEHPRDVPVQVEGQFYLSMAQAYFNQADSNSGERVQYYLDKYRRLPNQTQGDQQHFKVLEADFAAVERGQAWK